MIRFRLVGG